MQGIDINGEVYYVSGFDDFANLVDQFMGQESYAYLCEVIDDLKWQIQEAKENGG